MSRPERILTAVVGMVGLAVPFFFVPMLVQMVAWVFFWPYFVNYPPDPGAEAWLNWISIGIPAAAYLIILFFVISWVRRAPTE